MAASLGTYSEEQRLGSCNHTFLCSAPLKGSSEKGSGVFLFLGNRGQSRIFLFDHLALSKGAILAKITKSKRASRPRLWGSCFLNVCAALPPDSSFLPALYALALDR